MYDRVAAYDNRCLFAACGSEFASCENRAAEAEWFWFTAKVGR